MLFDVPIFSVPALATPSLFDLPLAELQAVSARASAQRSPSTRAAYDLVMDAPGGSDGHFGRTFSGRCGERSHLVGTCVKTLHPSFCPLCRARSRAQQARSRRNPLEFHWMEVSREEAAPKSVAARVFAVLDTFDPT